MSLGHIPILERLFYFLFVTFLSTSILSSPPRYSKLILYISCPSARIITFSKEPWFLSMELLLFSHFSRVRLCETHRQQPTRLPCPRDSPGKNTGVGCYFLLQCMKVKNESEVTQLCLTLCNPMDCSLPGSSAHGIFQARVLEWGTIAFSEETL